MPSEPESWEIWIEWLKATWQFLAIMVILLGGYKDLLTFRREVMTQQVARTILAVPVRKAGNHPVSLLMEIKKKNRERANKRWGQMGALDRERWQEIENLANSAIQDAKEHLVRALRVEIQDMQDGSPQDSTSGREGHVALEDRIDTCLVRRELDIVQYDHLRKRLLEFHKSLVGQQGRGQ